MLKYLLVSAVDVFRDEGIRGVIREGLKYLSLYGSPKSLVKHRILRTLCPGLSIVKDIQGSQMVLNLSGGGIHTDLFMYGYREPEATKVMQGILNPGMTVFDIGANIGYYALMEARVCKQVFAIEPGLDNVSSLNTSIRLNGYSNISVHYTAIGDRDGTIRFSLNPASPNWHRVAKDGDKNAVIVPVTTLDTFWRTQGCPKVDLLRMDVEGYELSILKGACDIISCCLPAMFLEVHRDHLKSYGGSAREVLEFLAGYGYSVYKSFVLAKPGPIGKLTNLLKDNEAIRLLTEKGMATHLFFTARKE